MDCYVFVTCLVQTAFFTTVRQLQYIQEYIRVLVDPCRTFPALSIKTNLTGKGTLTAPLLGPYAIESSETQIPICKIPVFEYYSLQESTGYQP